MTAPIKILSKSAETFEERLEVCVKGPESRVKARELWRGTSKPRKSLSWVHLPSKVIDELTSWAQVSGDGYIGTGEPHRIMRHAVNHCPTLVKNRIHAIHSICPANRSAFCLSSRNYSPKQTCEREVWLYADERTSYGKDRKYLLSSANP